nr:nuclear transport factor 2 family protein [Microbacterium bovistercoris]
MSRTKQWLNGYIRAWKTKADGDIRALFTDDAEYWFQPDDPTPTRGIDAIIAAWREEEPSEPVFELDVLIEDQQLGVITGHVDYPGHESYQNLWEVHSHPTAVRDASSSGT